VSEPPKQSSPLQLDDVSARLMASISEGTLIGVIDLKSGQIQLFEASPHTDAKLRRFRGHQELLRHGLGSVAGLVGFSVELAGGRVRAFYRNSILNREYEDFTIEEAMMLKVLAALGWSRAADFRSYP
jgi:hypothetical protein